MSYYALFQGWLLLSQPPGCLGDPTTFATKQALRDLSRRSGLFPSWQRRLAPAASLVPPPHRGIRGLVGFGNAHCAPSPSSALPPRQVLTQHHYGTAVPPYISGRTSYLRVRLEFLPYPHLMPTLFNGCGFGPPMPFTASSSWTWIDHPVSGLLVLT